MSNHLTRELTRPEKIELEKALRQLVFNGSLSDDVYHEALQAIGFSNTGEAIEFHGDFGALIRISLSQEEVQSKLLVPYAN